MPRYAIKAYKPKVAQRYIPKNAKREEAIQRQVCTYLRKQYPHVIFRSDYASGLHLTINQARIHKSLQSGSGFPDLFIYHPSRGYYGMALELKKEGTSVFMKIGPRKGKLSTNPHIQMQAAVLNQLGKQGYFTNFAIGLDDAIKQIDWYFKKPENVELF